MRSSCEEQLGDKPGQVRDKPGQVRDKPGQAGVERYCTLGARSLIFSTTCPLNRSTGGSVSGESKQASSKSLLRASDIHLKYPLATTCSPLLPAR